MTSYRSRIIVERKAYRVHVDSFQIIRVGVVWLVRTVRIKRAHSLKKLLLEV
jgi:hypothetical protein